MVAPFTGAWIETVIMFDVRFVYVVAPFTGAWIETSDACEVKSVGGRSRPSRARGLKHILSYHIHKALESRPSRARGLKR